MRDKHRVIEKSRLQVTRYREEQKPRFNFS
jgi:hypothetical protein